jgi:hypothetical protein
MQQRPTIDHWMIGRGLISDPFTSMIKKIILEYPANKIELFSAFHDTLYAIYSESLLINPYFIEDVPFINIRLRFQIRIRF